MPVEPVPGVAQHEPKLRVSDEHTPAGARFVSSGGRFTAALERASAAVGADGSASLANVHGALNFSTASIARGAVSLSHAATFSARGEVVTAERSPQVHEEIAIHGQGLEQRWTFTKAPAGTGAVNVRVSLKGPGAIAEKADGIHVGGFVYGTPTWIGADGARTPLAMHAVGRSAVIEVPDAVVRASAYPAVLDPIVHAEVDAKATQPSSAANVLPPGVRASALAIAGNTALVAWADQRTGMESIFAARVDLATNTVGKTIKIAVNDGARPFTGQSSGVFDLRVTAGKQSFFVTWANATDVLLQPMILGVRVPVDEKAQAENVRDSVPVFLGLAPYSLVRTFDAIHRHGVTAGAGGFMVVYDTPTLGVYDVHAVFVDETAPTAIVREFNLGSTSPDFQYPQVSSDGLQFFAVWRRTVSGVSYGSLSDGGVFDSDVFGALFNKEGVLADVPRRLSTTFNSTTSADFEIAFVSEPDAPGVYMISLPSAQGTLALRVIGGTTLTVPNPSPAVVPIPLFGNRVWSRGDRFVIISDNCLLTVLPDGTPSPDPCVDLALEAGENATSLAFAGTTPYLTTEQARTFTDPASGKTVQLGTMPRLRKVAAASTVSDLSRAKAAQNDLSGAFSRTQSHASYFVAWSETSSSGPAVYGSCVTVDPQNPAGTARVSPSAILSPSEVVWSNIVRPSVTSFSGPVTDASLPAFAIVFGGKAASGVEGIFGGIVQCDANGNVSANRAETLATVPVLPPEPNYSNFAPLTFAASESNGSVYVFYKAPDPASPGMNAILWNGKSAASAPFTVSSFGGSNPIFGDPASACDRGYCLVAWSQLTGEGPRLLASYVRNGETNVTPPRVTYSAKKISIGVGAAIAPDGAGHFGVAFRQVGGDSLTLSLATLLLPTDPSLLDPASEVLSSADPVRVSRAGDEARAPSIASFGDQSNFVAVWANRTVNSNGFGNDGDVYANVRAIDGRVLLPEPLVITSESGTSVGDAKVDEDYPIVVGGLTSTVLVAYRKLDMADGVAAGRIGIRIVTGEAVPGTSCTSGDQCATRFCVEGACCATACDEGCGTNQGGVCVALPKGTACGRALAFACDGTSTACRTGCTTNSECSGLSECRVDATGVGVCVSLRNVCLDEHTVVGGTDCGGYKCRDGVCLAKCESSEDCFGGNVCAFDTNRCIEPPPINNDPGCSTTQAPVRSSVVGFLSLIGLVALSRRRRIGGVQ